MLKIYSDKYNNIFYSNSRLLAFTGIITNEDITDKIDTVQVLDKLTRGGNRRMGMALTGGVVAGVVGAIVGACYDGRYSLVRFRITLTNGEEFMLDTDKQKLIDYLMQFTPRMKRRYNR